eukprot:gnl/MRDRNA2_/MRDRNA2_156709_c0_seq1.p1 gnl/MRDRNA2_/MRDRNA2_156709_c0~~gnl/MRDRNA2_/MRDRNA2_156709_c0_seq1.p1  ORF type:complete len:431 (-),score=90.31 gnl/MRDRNA2_/MRDRNA2_156709_c0_seq1:202-1494(-)
MFQDYQDYGHEMPDFMGGSPQATPHKDLGGLGDFYGGGEQMSHGVPLASSQMMFKCSDGDPYAEQEDVYRGVSMGQATGLSGMDAMNKALAGDIYSGPSESTAFGGYVSPAESTDKFRPDDVPPDQPQSSHFHFEATTVFVAVDTPHLLGNALLDFLGTQVVSSVSKVSIKKFAIKADCFKDHIMCSLKVRVWKTPNGEFAIEFQRRQGDSFAFGDVYSQASQFLKQRFPTIRGGPAELERKEVPKPPEFPEYALTQEDLTSVLEMAKMHTFPTLQAEAASSLAKMSCEESSALKILHTKETLDVLQTLLGARELDISYPTARVISELAKHEVEGRLAEHGILQAAISTCGASDTAQIVRLELAKAASESVRRSVAAMVSPAVSRGLSRALEDAMNELGEKSGLTQIRRNLEDVYWELKQYGYSEDQVVC